MHTHIWIFDLFNNLKTLRTHAALYYLLATVTPGGPENNIYFFPSVIQAGNIDALPLPRDAS